MPQIVIVTFRPNNIKYSINLYEKSYKHKIVRSTPNKLNGQIERFKAWFKEVKDISCIICHKKLGKKNFSIAHQLLPGTNNCSPSIYYYHEYFCANEICQNIYILSKH